MIAPFATIEAATAAGYASDIYVKDYTLCVVLADASGNALRTQRVRMKNVDNADTSGGTGIIVSTDAYRFHILANQFYSIGSKDAPVDLGGDGGDIVITVNSNWLWVGDGQDELPIL